MQGEYHYIKNPKDSLTQINIMSLYCNISNLTDNGLRKTKSGRGESTVF